MYVKTTFLRWLGSFMMTVILLFGTVQLMAQASLEITPQVLNLGDRPIGAWTEPATFSLDNTGVGAVTVNSAEITESDFFAIAGTFPQTIAEGDSYKVGISTFGTASPGVLNGNFGAFWEAGRAVTVASFTANAYIPVEGDVYEDPFMVAGFPVNLAGVSTMNFVDNYKLAGTATDGFDAVYMFSLTADQLVSVSLTGADAKMAVYEANFVPNDGPRAGNEIFAAGGVATDLPLFEGDYYLVVSTTAAAYDLSITVADMPAPDAAVYVAPADGAVDIVNGMELEWTLGANTLEYQVVLGTTYPPATIVVDWTELTEPSSPLEGTWMVANEVGSVGVGPNQGDIGWWSFGAGDLIQRACFLDDKYVFNADGSFQNIMDGETFLEPWQGGSNNCGTPVAPHDGSNAATFEYNESAGTVTLNGVGAYMGLPKVFNGGELNNPNNAPASITYLAELTDGGNTMFLDISIGGGWWRYKMVKTSSSSTTYTLANLEPNLQYFWQVNTRNNNETTMNPEIWGFTTTLSPPLNFAVSSDKIYEGDDLVLSWNNPLNGRALLGYNVYQDGVKLNDAILTNTNYTVSGLTYNMAGYDFAATTVYDEGESDFSDVVNVKVSGEGMVDGNVSDIITLANIAGASVQFAGNDEFGVAQSYNFTTDATGNYSGDILAGTYTISISADGYIGQTLPGVVVGYGATVTSNFELTEVAFPVAEVTASEFGENILIEWTFESARALVEFQVWRKKIYQPAGEELIGTTDQFAFVDFDWSMQDWGVYEWWVVAVYDLNQSDPVASNPIDKDMNTMVDVTVALNSAESPAGTLVVFTNVDESPELLYETTLDDSGVFAWEAFRKGTYDIEVSLQGYGTITETGVDIFDESSFDWLLIENLTAPTTLYVTPTGLASWSTSTTVEASPLEGTWMVANEIGSMGVGPVQGSMAWWSVPAGDLVARACFFDDKYVFNADGSFQNVMDGVTFLEPWQGGGFNCGAPVAPHDGSNAATFEYDESAGTITLNGTGAYMGLPKVYNGGELTNPNDAPPSITYLTDLSEDGNSMILDISVGGAWWRFHMVREDVASRSLQTYKIFFDGTLIGEQLEAEYQHGGFGETLVDGETYTTGVATVYTTGQSETLEFTWKYVACDNYDVPAGFMAEQVLGSLDINLSWTNLDAAAMDTISALRIYRNGVEYVELDFTGGAVSSYLDEDLAFGDYTYCLSYIYDSGAETCADAVCSETVTITGGGFVDGTITAFDGGAGISGAVVTVSNADFSFQFTTDDMGYYEGEVVDGTYNYLVEAANFESQTLEGVVIVFGATVTNDFSLLEFPFPVSNVMAELQGETAVSVTWNTPQTSRAASGRALEGYNVWRLPCQGGDYTLLGFTLDTTFVDNQYEGLDAGVYKWAVEAIYTNNSAEPQFSNCIDKDMITQVSVTVTTNSADSPAGTMVMFTNTSEPDLALVYETTLNATGYFMWEEFRKGTYDIAVNKTGFGPIEIMDFVIDSPEDFVWVLEELLLPVTDLYVNPNGLATWAGVGGPASPIQGTWQVAAELGSMGVGPVQGDMSWWSVGGIDLEVRSCFWDDRYIFQADGSFNNEFDDLTFLEPWQGVAFECGIPVAPHDGSADADFVYDEEAGTVTINGVGAFLGLPKVTNNGELTNPNDAPASITYLVELIDEGNTMLVDINFGGGWWRFKMVRAGTAAARALQGYKVWLDGILVTDTQNNFWQYDETNLVPGQEYFSEVAAIYTNGFSEKMNYTWTYVPCSDYAGPEVFNGEVINESDVLLTWSDEEPLELIQITQNPGAPANGYFQQFGYGYGVAYDLSAYPDALVNSLDFHHASWGVTGTWEYNIHIYDWDSKTLIETAGPFTTTGNDLWEMGIDLGDVATGGVNTVAILMEPLSNSPTDAYPDLSSDNAANPQGSIFGDLSNPNAIGASGIGNFLMEMYIYTAYGAVRATPVSFDYVEAPAAQAKSALNPVVEVPVITQSASSRQDDLFVGANVYRNGMLIAEMVQDTFYLDENVNGGEYTYCLRYVYESGAMTCEGAYCLDISVPCEAPENLTGEYVWNYNNGNPEFGALIGWSSGTPPVAEWLFYDDGINVDGIGGPAAFTWAIKFDPAQLADFDGASLTKIQIYNRLASTDELRIYEGTNATTLLHSQPLAGLDVEAWSEVELTSSVMLDVSKELWIAVYTTDGANFPAGCGAGQNQPNGDLITLDGVLWEHLTDFGLIYTWNLRGYVTTAAGATAALPMDKPADEYNNDVRSELTVSGTGAGANAVLENNSSRELSVFNVYRSDDGDVYNLIAAVPYEEGATTYGYFDTDVDISGYYYQVTALHTYADGTECESAPAMALENPEDDFVSVIITNTNEFVAAEARVFPNPARDYVTIEAKGMNRITVINTVGQVVYDVQIDNVRTQFNAALFEAGVYVIRISTDSGVVTKRLTIVR